MISFGSELLILAAYYEKFTRPRVFAVASLATAAFGAYPALKPGFSSPDWTAELLGACQEYITASNVPEQINVVGPYNTIGRIDLTIGVVAFFILFCGWLSLRWLQSGRRRSDSIMVSAILNSAFSTYNLSLLKVSESLYHHNPIGVDIRGVRRYQ
jgi:hypothetical protein